MPELPDIQVFKEYCDATSLHQPIANVDVRRDDVLGDLSLRSLQRRLKGKTLKSTRRHGKYLFAETGDCCPSSQRSLATRQPPMHSG